MCKAKGRVKPYCDVPFFTPNSLFHVPGTSLGTVKPLSPDPRAFFPHSRVPEALTELRCRIFRNLLDFSNTRDPPHSRTCGSSNVSLLNSDYHLIILCGECHSTHTTPEILAEFSNASLLNYDGLVDAALVRCVTVLHSLIFSLMLYATSDR